MPWSRASVTGLVHASTAVISEIFEDEGTRFRIRAAPEVLARLNAALA